MPEPVNWAALRRVFETPAKDGVAAHSEDMELLIERAEERAAIMEYDGGLSREEAEAFAFRNLPQK